MTVEKMEKARTARVDCIEKRRLEKGPRIMETRKKETRVANVTRNFGAEWGKATFAALSGRDE